MNTPRRGKIKKTDRTNCWQGRATSVARVLCQGRTNPHELGWPLPARVCFYAHTRPVCLHVVTKAGFVGAKTQRPHGQWKEPCQGRCHRCQLSGRQSAWSLKTTKWTHGDRNQTRSTETWLSGRVLASCDHSPNTHPTPTKRQGKNMAGRRKREVLRYQECCNSDPSADVLIGFILQNAFLLNSDGCV